jgi:hypothetical protein
MSARSDIVGFRDGSPIRRHPDSTSGAEDPADDSLTAEIKAVLAKPEVRLTFTWALGMGGVHHGVMIEHRDRPSGRWTKYPYAVYATGDQTVADVMFMMATTREEMRAS